jgi:hypothetical protein
MLLILGNYRWGGHNSAQYQEQRNTAHSGLLKKFFKLRGEIIEGEGN